MQDTGISTEGGTATLADLRSAQRGSHDVFRSMVDALSHPGRPTQLPTGPATVPTTALPILALADLQTTLALVGDDELAPLVHRVTGAPAATPDAADLAAVAQAELLTGRLVDLLRIGSAHAPELGARLIATVDAIGSDDDLIGTSSVRVGVTGPGSSNGRSFRVAGLDPAGLRALDRRNEAYPAGIDTWLVAPDGQLVAIPRSNRIDVVTDGGR